MIEAVRELGPIIDQIEFNIPQTNKLPKQKSRLPRRVAASGIKDCSRQWYFKLHPETQKFIREEKNPKWELLAAYGTVIHDQVQQALIDQGFIKNTEQFLPENEFFISGRKDGELTYRPALIEIKTTSQAAWSKFPNHEKFESYSDQIQTYLELLGLPEALLICIRREPIIEGRTDNIRKSLVKEFIIKRNKEHGQRLLDKGLYINKSIETNVVPPAEPSFACMFCSFKHLCEIEDVRESLK